MKQSTENNIFQTEPKHIYAVDIEEVVEYLQEHLFINEEGYFALDHDFNLNDLYNLKGHRVLNKG